MQEKSAKFSDTNHLLAGMDQDLIQLPGATTHFPHHGKFVKNSKIAFASVLFVT